MAKVLAAQKGIEDHEFGPEVDKAIDILKGHIRNLIDRCGAVTLSTDCFASKIEVIPSCQGLNNVDAVMNNLTISLRKVFLDEGISFKITVGNKIVSIEKSKQHVADFERYVLSRKVEDKGRIAISGLKFLKQGFPVNLYSKTVGGKVYVVISNRGNLGLDEQGFNQKLAAVDGHKRISLSGTMDPKISDHSCNVKVVVRGSYAVIISDGEDSQFASLEDYEAVVLPLLEALQ